MGQIKVVPLQNVFGLNVLKIWDKTFLKNSNSNVTQKNMLESLKPTRKHNGVNGFGTLKIQIHTTTLKRCGHTILKRLATTSLLTENYFLQSNATSNASWTQTSC